MQHLHVATGSCAKSAGIGADVTGSTAIELQRKELKMCLKKKKHNGGKMQPHYISSDSLSVIYIGSKSKLPKLIIKKKHEHNDK